MSSPAAFTTLLQDYGWKPNGTGPFKIAEVVTGSFVRMVRNENYWGKDKDGNKLPYLDEITIKVLKDETVLASALKTGEIDVAYLPNREVDAFLGPIREVQCRKDGRWRNRDLDDVNPDVAPMNDINLRRAVAHAINPADINKAAYFGKATVAQSGMSGCESMGLSAEPRLCALRRQEGARGTCRRRQARKQFRGEHRHMEPAGASAVGGNRAGAARPSGYQGEYRGADCGPCDREVLLRQGDSFVPHLVEPVSRTGLHRLHQLQESGAYYNASKQVNADIDALIQQGAATYDQNKRKEIYAKINDYELGQVLWRPMLYSVTYAAAPKKVQNLNTLLSWDGKMRLKQIWIKP